MPEQQTTPHEILRRYYGYDSFRPHQEEIITSIIQGRDVLAVMPTSAGKSLCYQVPSLIVDGVTIVVSPLVALMYDQVQNLRQLGIPSAYLNSALDGCERYEVLESIRKNDVRLVYVAPERLNDPQFVALCKTVTIAVVAVDEAHCISQWGNDFRPSYQRISAFIDMLPKRPCVCALTATATPTVRDDIRESLQLKDPLVVISSFDRPNLSFAVKRFSRMRDKDDYLLQFVTDRPTQSGIIYCSTRKAVDDVWAMLVACGVEATRYHAGLSHDERDCNQNEFVHDVRSVVVATNAFGMGIDKSNVSYVVHYNVPLSLEAYYQEAGRAGRDGMPAECLVLYSKKDVRTAQFLIDKSAEQPSDLTPEQKHMRLEQDKERLKRMTFYCTTSDCLRGFIMRYFGEVGPRACSNCSNCVTTFVVRDATVDAQKVVSCVLRLSRRHQKTTKRMIIDILHGADTKAIRESEYDTLSTYGIMAEKNIRYIERVVEQLCEYGYLDISNNESSVVVETPSTREIIRPNARFSIRVPVAKSKSVVYEAQRCLVDADQNKTSAKATSHKIQVDADALFEALKAVRKTVAKEAGVAPYIVFSDAALKDMCELLPTTKKAFLQVNGVGEIKMQRYGRQFIDCIKCFKNAQV